MPKKQTAAAQRIHRHFKSLKKIRSQFESVETGITFNQLWELDIAKLQFLIDNVKKIKSVSMKHAEVVNDPEYTDDENQVVIRCNRNFNNWVELPAQEPEPEPAQIQPEPEPEPAQIQPEPKPEPVKVRKRGTKHIAKLQAREKMLADMTDKQRAAHIRKEKKQEQQRKKELEQAAHEKELRAKYPERYTDIRNARSCVAPHHLERQKRIEKNDIFGRTS